MISGRAFNVPSVSATAVAFRNSKSAAEFARTISANVANS